MEKSPYICCVSNNKQTNKKINKMENRKEKIEIISAQQSEKIAIMIEKIKDGDMTARNMVSELQTVKKMIDNINIINNQ